MSETERASEPEDIPSRSAELILLRVLIESIIATSHEKPKLRAASALRVAAEILATEESVALVMPIRPRSQHAATAKARREAVAVFRQWLPVFLARMPK